MQSQNGWQTIDGSDLDKSPIPGTDVVPIPGLQRGDVATVLLEVGRLFNETVAPVYNPGCWGWNTPMPIPGSSIFSNHGSGTAIDFNAPSFPQGLHRMTAAQAEACRAIVARMDGLVQWGGDYTTTVDQMHFEIIGTPDQIRELAKKIKGGNTMAEDLWTALDEANKDRDRLWVALNQTNMNFDRLVKQVSKDQQLIDDSFKAVDTTNKRVDKLESKEN